MHLGYIYTLELIAMYIRIITFSLETKDLGPF